MSYYYTQTRTAKISKIIIPRKGKNVEQLEFSQITDKNLK